MIIKFIASKPLKPSIKFAPLITNKKHNNTNTEENIWLDIKGIKNGIFEEYDIYGNKISKIKYREGIVLWEKDFTEKYH